jgi:tetratricopeptide (TPR) repeat protein
LKAVDDQGKLIFWSGHVPTLDSGKKGPVDPGAHFYRSVLLDGHGNYIDKRNLWSARSTIYSRSIPPGATDLVRYRLDIPEDSGDQIFLTAKVNHRKFSWKNTQFAYAGITDPEDTNSSFTKDYDDRNWIYEGDSSNVSGKMKEIPDLPITTMAAATAEIRVSSSPSFSEGETTLYLEEDAQRWNNYGIALLLHREYQAAEQIFLKLTEVSPTYGEGWINYARSMLKQGYPKEARTSLLRAQQLVSNPGKVDFFLGVAAKEEGNLESALAHLRLAESAYPKDRRIVFQLGRTLLLQEQYEAAIQVFKRGVQIDPEDIQFHYQLSLCYEALGDADRARFEWELHDRFRPRIAAPFGTAAPEDENERHPIHEHKSAPLDAIRDSKLLTTKSQRH